jgi:methanogenic corrinoid protein MtbC1
MSGSMHLPTAGHSQQTANPGRYSVARSRDRLRLLADTIEAEIVPRLIAVYDQAEPAQRDWPQHETIAELDFTAIPQEAVDLAMLVLGDDEKPARDEVVRAVADRGLEAVCLELLAPAARHLGDLWTEDLCSFTDVTIGLMRLQSALLHVTTPPADLDMSARRTALLAPAPGDQHSFGLTMVAGFLERAGWTVTQLHDGAPASVEAALRAGWYGVLGLSAGSTVRLAALQHMLPRLRAMSRNPDLGVMVGGPLFLETPGLAAEIGADGTAADGPHAVHMAESLIAPHPVRRARAPRAVHTPPSIPIQKTD